MMNRLEHLLNQVEHWSQSSYLEPYPSQSRRIVVNENTVRPARNWRSKNNDFKIQYFTCPLALLECSILEIFLAMQNLLRLPFQPPAALLKYSLKYINYVFHFECLQRVEDSLSGIPSIMKTIKNIIKFLFGACVSIGVGLYNPQDAIRLHKKWGLINISLIEKIANENIEIHRRQLKTFGLVLSNHKKGRIFTVDLAARKQVLDHAAEKRVKDLRFKLMISRVFATICKKHHFIEHKVHLDLLNLVSLYEHISPEVFSEALLKYRKTTEAALLEISEKLNTIKDRDQEMSFKERIDQFCSLIEDLNPQRHLLHEKILEKKYTFNVAEADAKRAIEFQNFYQKEREERAIISYELMKKYPQFLSKLHSERTTPSAIETVLSVRDEKGKEKIHDVSKMDLTKSKSDEEEEKNDYFHDGNNKDTPLNAVRNNEGNACSLM